jgi:hypothetical protein
MRRSIERSTAVFSLSALMIGCSTVEVVPPAEPDDEYVFACDKVAGQPACETRAAEVCPIGYETLSSEEDFERKELRIRCSGTAGEVHAD